MSRSRRAEEELGAGVVGMGDEGLELALEAVEPRGVFGFQNLQLFSRLLGQPRLERHALTEMTWWRECFLWIVERFEETL